MNLRLIILEGYPNSNSKLYDNDLVILKTNSFDNKRMVDLVGYSYKEANNILKLMDVNYSIEGNGYVYEQSVNAGDDIGNDEIIVKLKEKW